LHRKAAGVIEMSEVLVQFAEAVTGRDGRVYRAQACGAPTNQGLWQGWIEFIPVTAGGTPLRSPRETTQPNRADAIYWATGLRLTYLEGALDRAQRGPIVKTIVPEAQPLFEAPAPDFITEPHPK
jgi:hypothetical protein